MTAVPMVDGFVYLQIRHYRVGYISELRVMKATQRRPDVLEPNCVLVRLQLQMPGAAFEPLEPQATVIVPAELVQHPIVVEAGTP